VQGALEAAIQQTAGASLTIEAAGRTDSGVHASGQVVSFRSEARLTPAEWGRALNSRLPADVAVRACAAVADGFHARYTALGRSYRYRVLCDTAPSPLRERYALRVGYPVDVEAMDAAARELVGEHDFAAFGSSPRDQRGDGQPGHCVRVMREARCRRLPPADGGERGDEVAFDFTANAFLTGMVRRLVGVLLLVGSGRLAPEDVAVILAARDKTHPGAAVAARGLCLVGVTYPAGAVEWEKIDI
jgi:tRNA pseudouridine38-40 synthase